MLSHGLRATGTAIAMAMLLGTPLPTRADPVTATLFYTTFAGGSNVHKVDVIYNGTTLSLANNTNIAATTGADGIVFLPNGNLAVGGQGGSAAAPVHEVSPGGTIVNSVAGGSPGGAYHLSLSPDGTKLYVASIPGGLGVMTLTGAGALGAVGSTLALSGSVSGVDSLAFAAGKVFYTSSGSGGNGSFGTINLTTGATSQIYGSLPAAHGMTFDPFTGDLMLYGANHITQIDPVTNAIVSDLTTIGALDQGTTDGKGHVFAACNCGNLVFIDMAATGLVGAGSNFVATPFLANALDDVAPLVGPGGQKVPEPGALALVALAMFALWSIRRRRQRE